jgi:heat shock protein HslJ
MKKIKLILSLIFTITLISSSCGVMNEKTSAKPDYQNLSGTWVLSYITGLRIAFEGLYPGQKPTLIFDIEMNHLSGNTSCNSYGSEIVLNRDEIQVGKPYSTMMACEGLGESTYINTLLKVERFKVQVDTLIFYMGDIEMMRFVKQ